jgi:hypothetical protein
MFVVAWASGYAEGVGVLFVEPVGSSLANVCGPVVQRCPDDVGVAAGLTTTARGCGAGAVSPRPFDKLPRHISTAAA